MTEQHTAHDQAPAGNSEQQDAHAAMCIYCGEAVIYDTRQANDMEEARRQLLEHDQQCPKNPLVTKIRTIDAAVFALFGYLSAHHPDACADMLEVFGGETWQGAARHRDALTTFVSEAIDAAFDGCGLDGAWIQERAEQLGLLTAEAYDPKRHPDAGGTQFEPGDTIYVRQLRMTHCRMTPASLVRRDARMRAEALEELVSQTSQYKEANPVRGLAGFLAEEYRRQAEQATTAGEEQS